jgi:uncharacterized protein YndB with AHSA1/START domain
MESNENSTITATKEFKVPVDALYKAWTDGEQLKQWWKPMNLTLTEVVNELKEGGEIAYKFEGESDTSLTIQGNYQEVQAPQRLVYTWNWLLPNETLNSKYKLDVQFTSTGEGSSINITQKEEEQQESVKPKASAWDVELNNLAHFLESSSESTSDSAETGQSAPLSNTQSRDASSTAMDQEGKPDYGSQNALEDQQ